MNRARLRLRGIAPVAPVGARRIDHARAARARVLPILFADPARVAVANAIGLAIPSVCVLHA